MWTATKPMLRRRRDAHAYLATAGATADQGRLIKLADQLDNLLSLPPRHGAGMRYRVLEKRAEVASLMPSPGGASARH